MFALPRMIIYGYEKATTFASIPELERYLLYEVEDRREYCQENLYGAVEDLNFSVVEFLFQHGASLKHDWVHNLILRLAIKKGSVRMLQLLFHHGASATIWEEDNDWCTGDTGSLVRLAASYGNVAVFDLLLEHRANMDASVCTGHSPFLIAVREGHLELARAMIMREYGANLNHKTRLVLPAQSPLSAVCHLWIYEPKRIVFWTPVQVAMKEKHYDVVKLLLDHGASLAPVRNKKCLTELHAATDRVSLAITPENRLLLQYAASLQQSNVVFLALRNQSQWGAHGPERADQE